MRNSTHQRTEAASAFHKKQSHFTKEIVSCEPKSLKEAELLYESLEGTRDECIGKVVKILEEYGHYRVAKAFKKEYGIE